MTIAASNRSGADRARAVVCDLDGTLIDTERIFAEAARRILARRGRELEPAFMATMQGTPGREALPRFRERYGLHESVEAIAAEYKQAFFECAAENPPALMAGARELLDWLESRMIPKAIATSSSRAYVDSVFAPLGLLGRFEFVLTIDDVTNGKPHPEIYQLAAERLQMPPGQVVVLEDSPAGVQAACAAGTRCVMVDRNCQPVDGVLVVPTLHAPQVLALLEG